MDDSEPTHELDRVEEIPVHPFPVVWVLFLGGLSTGLSSAAWVLFFNDPAEGPIMGGKLVAGSLFLGFVSINLSRGNTLGIRLLSYLGATLGVAFLATLIGYFVFGLIHLFQGDLPTPPAN